MTQIKKIMKYEEIHTVDLHIFATMDIENS